jgi:hypothetical protein
LSVGVSNEAGTLGFAQASVQARLAAPPGTTGKISPA